MVIFKNVWIAHLSVTPCALNQSLPHFNLFLLCSSTIRLSRTRTRRIRDLKIELNFPDTATLQARLKLKGTFEPSLGPATAFLFPSAFFSLDPSSFWTRPVLSKRLWHQSSGGEQVVPLGPCTWSHLLPHYRLSIQPLYTCNRFPGLNNHWINSLTQPNKSTFP